jgi:transposase
VDPRRENDIEQLRRIALTQKVQIDQLLRVLTSKCKELEALKGSPGELQQTIELLNDVTRRALADGAEPEESDAESRKKERKARTQFGNTPQRRLKTEEVVFELDEPDKACPACGGELKPMEGQFETSEMIDVIEVSYRVLTAKQQKYVCRCGGCVETAPGPERALPGSRYSLAFAIKVVIDKYLDHLPLSRQVRILDRHGVEITSQTLWDLVNAVATRLQSHYDALFAHVMRQPVIGLDQTGWKRLESKGGKPWQMWCLTTPDAVYHRICDDKSAGTFKALVGAYEGVIVCDALKTHEAGARAGPGIVLAGCWAHVFRKFVEAEPDHPEAALALGWIRELYDIDERAEGDLERLAELRCTESTLVLDKMKTWLWSQATLKTLSIGKAAAYAIANWERLTRFVDHARVPLDNNATERGIRGPVVGRKNHYGSKSRRGTEAAAILYSLIETAKLHDVNPSHYLAEAVRAANVGETIMPWQLR